MDLLVLTEVQFATEALQTPATPDVSRSGQNAGCPPSRLDRLPSLSRPRCLSGHRRDPDVGSRRPDGCFIVSALRVSPARPIGRGNGVLSSRVSPTTSPSGAEQRAPCGHLARKKHAGQDHLGLDPGIRTRDPLLRKWPLFLRNSATGARTCPIKRLQGSASFPAIRWALGGRRPKVFAHVARRGASRGPRPRDPEPVRPGRR